MAIFRGSGSSLTGSAIDPTEALLDSDFTVNGILVRTGSGVYSTTPDNTANWDTAYSWGDWSVGVDKPFVDGLNVDADTLDSQEGTWYQDRTNHTGTQTLSTISDSGTAAAADLTTSHTDTTSGRVLKVGDYGWGSDGSIARARPSDYNDIPVAGYYQLGGSAANNPFGGSTAGLTEVFSWDADETIKVQNVFGIQSLRNIVRVNDGGGFVEYEQYHNRNILGTVSQSSGVPTGAIFESDENASGEYVKLPNGWAFATNGNAAITSAPMTFVGTITKIDGDKLWIGRWY